MVAKTTALVLSYGKSPEKIKTSPSFATEDERMPPQGPPLGVPRERCPFSVRVGGVSIRVLKSYRREASDRPSLPYPGLGHVTASDTFPLLVQIPWQGGFH